MIPMASRSHDPLPVIGPWSSPECAALKATKTKLNKELSLVGSEPEGALTREQISQLDRRIAAFQLELVG
jgi:hypothetical protein